MNERRPAGEIVHGLRTKSEKIRALADAGYERAEIAKYLGIIYQHVRNVLAAGGRAQRTLYNQAPRPPGV
jgi:hypothetical protein